MREEGKQGKHGPFAKPIKERSQGKKEGRGEVVKASRWPRIDKKTIIRERRRELVKSRRIYDLTLITPSSTTRRFTPRERRIFFPPIFFFFSLPSSLPPLKNLFSVHAIRRKKEEGGGGGRTRCPTVSVLRIAAGNLRPLPVVNREDSGFYAKIDILQHPPSSHESTIHPRKKGMRAHCRDTRSAVILSLMRFSSSFFSFSFFLSFFFPLPPPTISPL